MYGKEAADGLNKIWGLHKKKIAKETHSAEWWQETVEEFNAVAEGISDEDAKGCIGHYAVAALLDIQDKSLGRKFETRCHVLAKDFTIEEFAEYLKDAKEGDCFSVNGVKLEVK